MIYLDHAATTPLHPEAAAAMQPFFEGVYGNSTGNHAAARASKDAVEAAREEAAEMLGAGHPLEVVFTGGGSEADNLAIAGPTLADTDRSGIVITAVEHAAVLEASAFVGRRGKPVRVVGVDPDGVVDPERLAAAIDDQTAVVSVMAANNETGVLHPVADVVSAVVGRMPDVLVHTDAIQSFVTHPVRVSDLSVDLLSLSGHKFGGPQGVGLLYVRSGTTLEPVIHGGGQELGRRSGTHNVAGIVGMVAAMKASNHERASVAVAIEEARDRFESRLRERLRDVDVTAEKAPRLASHSHVRFPGVSSETLLVRLDQHGVAASAGASCHSGAVTASHVLEAMGWGKPETGEALRFSFGRGQDAATGLAAADRVADVVETLT